MLAYVEAAVHPALRDSVVCTWVDPDRDDRQPVLPDACIDLVWDGAAVTVAGPDTHANTESFSGTFVGIRFLPGAAPGFLRASAEELVDRRVPLADLWGSPADELAERLASRPGAAEAQRMLEAALLARLYESQPIDPLIEQVIDELAQPPAERAAGAALAVEVGVSERTLRRRCVAALGYGPKTLERVLRFRHALRLIRSAVPLADVAQCTGYADQAHLNNEFRRLGAAPPRQLARRGRLVISSNGGH